ncbi:hypothetical protein M0804_007261 [Polistes exclamans]|nr:hypothetical protein M0804_007261 [Polistes exclamans]
MVQTVVGRRSGCCKTTKKIREGGGRGRGLIGGGEGDEGLMELRLTHFTAGRVTVTNLKPNATTKPPEALWVITRIPVALYKLSSTLSAS